MTFLKALKPPHRHVAGMVLQLALYCVLCMGNTRESRVALPREIHLQHPQEQRYLILTTAVHKYFRVSPKWYGCQCLGFLTCAQNNVDECVDCALGLYEHRLRVMH